MLSSDGSIVLCRKDTIVSRELIARLSTWIVEEEPRGPTEKRVRRPPKRDQRLDIIKKLEFEEIVSTKTRKELEKGATGFFENMKNKSTNVSIAAVEDSIGSLVDGAPDNPDVPLKLSQLKKLDSYVYQHSIECGIIASFITSALNYPQSEIASFSMAMMLHDTGILQIPENLFAKTTPLTNEDWIEIKKHPRYGWNLLKEVPGMDPLALMVAIGHHSNADASGYPEKVEFNDLPDLVHLATIIDHFEALTTARPYRPAYHMHDAVEIIMSQREKYHPGAIENFISVVGIYPITTFLQLSTGEVGVVVRNNPENLFLPEIKLTLDPAGKAYSKEIIVNLLNEPVRKIMKVVDDI